MEAFLYINCMIRVLFVASRDRLWINRFIGKLGITAHYISRERKVCIAQKYDSRIGSSVTLARPVRRVTRPPLEKSVCKDSSV